MMMQMNNTTHDSLCSWSTNTDCFDDSAEDCWECTIIFRARLAERKLMIMEEYMCPFCVTPWKCNGPHIDQGYLSEFEAYVQQVREETRAETLRGIPEEETPHGASTWHAGYRVGFDEGYLEGRKKKKKNRKEHDPLCNIYEETCCPWMGECECQCNCDFIQEIREDQDARRGGFV